MTIIEQLKEFLSTCPFLQVFDPLPGALLRVDYLGEKSTQYMIQPTPGNPWIKQYLSEPGVVRGIKQFPFVFASREMYGAEMDQDVANTSFYENFEEWFTLSPMPYPDWLSMEVLTGGYLMFAEEGQDKAQYQIQCRIQYYYEKGTNNNG